MTPEWDMAIPPAESRATPGKSMKTGDGANGIQPGLTIAFTIHNTASGENAMRQEIAVIVFMALALEARAQDRCMRAASPSDVLPVEDCTGCPTAAPDAFFRTLNRLGDENTIPIGNRKLASIASEAVRDALNDGASVGTRFNVTDHGVLGIDTGIAMLTPDKMTDAQRETARDGSVFLRHNVSAQAGGNLGATVPVGPHGFYVRTGVGAGANFSVVTDRRYDPRTAEAARRAVVNHLTIPLAALDAAEMRPGERVVISGNGNVAVSGGGGWGANTRDIVPGVRAGAAAETAVTHVLSGAFETEVSREAGRTVRVKLRTGHANDTSGDVRLFAGVAVGRDALEIPVETGINVLDATVERGIARGAARLAEEALSASLVHRNGALSSVGDLQEYTFDLGRREARRAYEDALKGDFRAAAELASCGGSGVGFVIETNDRVKTLYRDTKLRVSFLKYSIESNSTDTVRTIRDAAGTRRFEMFSYHHGSRGFFGSRDSVDVGTVNAMTGNIGDDGKSVHLTYVGEMENRHWTSRGEMKDLVHLGRTMAGNDVRANAEFDSVLRSPRVGASIIPSFLNYYGRTKMRLDLTVSETGIANIASASRDDMWKAFAAGHRDQPLWATAEGREQMEEYLRWAPHDGNDSGRYNAERYWEYSYKRARSAIENLSRVGATANERERARLLRDAAQAMGDDFTAGAALALLSGEPGRAVSYKIKNDNVDYTWSAVGSRAEIVGVR